MELFPIVLKYVDSLIGVVALVTSLFVLITCRTMVRALVVENNRTNDRLHDDTNDLRKKIEDVQVKQSGDYQLRGMCIQQHEHINQRLNSFERWVSGLEKKIEDHTEQILTAIKGTI
jgi:hypothetical protein